MTMPLVSIIIAVYNSESLLPRCLDSLLCQTHSNIEIIVVDDASTDRTPQVARSYAERDNRVLVTRMEQNGGAPAARNKGMSMSRGKYMTTVDADDALSPDAIQQAVRMMEADDEIDMVVYRVITVNTHTGQQKDYPLNPQVPLTPMSGEEACFWTMQWDMPGWSVSRSPLEQNMPEESEYGQYGDETTTHLLFLKARKVALSNGIYYYYQEPTSYTNKVSYKRFEILECRISLRRHLIDEGAGDRLIRRLDVRRWREFIGTCYLFWKHRQEFSPVQQAQILERLSLTYQTFHWQDLPLTTVLKPRFMMLPGFQLFYAQLRLVFQLKLFRL